MPTTNKTQNAQKNSKGTAIKTTPIDILPENVQIHIASYDAHNGVFLFCPSELSDSVHGLPEGTTVKVTIDYPLLNPLTYELPFSHVLNNVLENICEKYKEIYREEEETTTVEAGPIGETPSGIYLMNRCTTTGKYGIWGHDIGDLYIEKLELDTAKKELILYVGS